MYLIRLICIVWLAAISPVAAALDVRAMVETAVELVDRGQPELARVYLEPALISPELHDTERSRAYYVRGYSFYDQGLYVSARLDYNRALEFNPDNPGALVALADLQRVGQGIGKNPGYAFQLYEKAAMLGHTVAKVATGRALLLGEGTEADAAQARRWLAEAASEGDANAMLHLAGSFRLESAGPVDPAQAKAWYEKAAATGAAEGLVAIGFMYAQGEFGGSDPAEAVRWYRRAADLGLAAGQALLGHAFLEGRGTARDPAEAGRWFEKAAAQGDANAQVALGFLFEAGEGRAVNREQALRWYRRAALAGDTEGMGRYAWAMVQTPDLASQREAVIWLRKLASEDIEAANTAAWILATSVHEELRNGAEAVRLAELAVQKSPVSPLLDTLAAAYAEAGEFSKAIEIQRRAVAALSADEARFRREMEERLTGYEQGRPWRE